MLYGSRRQQGIMSLSAWRRPPVLTKVARPVAPPHANGQHYMTSPATNNIFTTLPTKNVFINPHGLPVRPVGLASRI